MASRVVPGCSLTTRRSWPTMRLIKEDLPTLGRPTTATRISSGEAVSADAFYLDVGMQ